MPIPSQRKTGRIYAEKLDLEDLLNLRRDLRRAIRVQKDALSRKLLLANSLNTRRGNSDPPPGDIPARALERFQDYMED